MKKSLHLLLLFLIGSSIIAKAQLSFSKDQHDFGISTLGTLLEYEFQYVNHSSETVLITFVKTSCSCLKVSWNKTKLEPGEVGTLGIAYLATVRRSYQEEVFIYVNNNPTPFILSVVGTVGDEDTNIPLPSDVTVKSAPPSSVMQEPFKPKVLPKPPSSTFIDNNTGDNSRTSATAAPGKPIVNVETISNQSQSVFTNNNLFTDIATDYLGDETLNTGVNEMYLTNREKAMIKEINLIRSNPSAYTYVVESYIRQLENTNDSKYRAEIMTAYELIKVLKQTPKLSILIPNLNIYNAAKKHGKEATIIDTLRHIGLDGSMPWDRIMAADASMQDGNKNIVGGLQDIRRMVLTLLIDTGIEGRGHRRNILKDEWTHIAVYEVGQVGNIPFMWLQEFGQIGISKTSMPLEYDELTSDKPVNVINQEETYPVEAPQIVPKSVNINGQVPNPQLTGTLSREEQFFIQEINYLRSNPKLYAQFVANYLSELEAEKATFLGREEEIIKRIDAAVFVKDYLAKANALPTLNINESLYKAAVEHGEDCKNNGKLSHWGSDGSTTWQRLQRKSTTIIDGDQYLISDVEDVRESIIKILVDDAIYHRDRDNILLRADWTDCAANSVGDVGIKEHCWVIVFGKY